MIRRRKWQKKDNFFTNEQKRKAPRNVLRKGIIAVLVGLTITIVCLGFTACSFGLDGKDGADGIDGTNGKDGINGQDGSQWYSGTETPTIQGVNGDFYLDTDDYILYQKINGQWVAIMTNFGKPGADGANGNDGTDGKDGIDGTNGVNGLDGKDGSDILFGVDEPSNELGKDGDLFINKTNWDVYEKQSDSWNLIGNIKGEKGDKGNDGKDGVSIYVGYDGYIWEGAQRTTYKLEDTVIDKTSAEDTLKLVDVDKYFTKTSETENIALLGTRYFENTYKTGYSGRKISEITVYCESTGTLNIGVADVYKLATTSNALITVKQTMEITHTGLNTITLSTPIQVGENETLTLGGVSLRAYANVNAPDNYGSYDLIGNQGIEGIGKLVVKVKVQPIEQQKLFSELENKLRTTAPTISVVPSIAPFYFTDTTLFENKNITSISMYIKTVSYTGDNATFTIKLLDTPSNFDLNATVPTSFIETYTIKVPKSFFNGQTTINSWVDIDLTQYAYKSNGDLVLNGIAVGEKQTLAFYSSTDTIVFAVDAEYKSSLPFFITSGGKFASGGTNGLYFLFGYESEDTFDKNIVKLEEENAKANQKATALSFVLNNKKMSVLGDSISTYKGVSNNTAYNSTIGSNAVHYGTGSFVSVVEQKDTYWQQVIDQCGMTLCVNNSWSGGTVTGINGTNAATNRASQLHNAIDEKPDVIVVYIGINDIRYKQDVVTFEEAYLQMLNIIKTHYPNAEVFCVGLPNRSGNDYENGEYLDEEAQAFCTAISNAITSAGDKFHYVDMYNSEYKDQVYFDTSVTLSYINTYTNSTLDNLHPNADGMDYITDLIIDKMYEILIG